MIGCPLVKQTPLQAALQSELAHSAADRSSGVAPARISEIGLVDIMSAVEETAYIWDITSDRIEWESNAQQVLGIRSIDTISSVAAISKLR